MNVRIVLVDDHRMVRDGLRLVLEKEPGFSIVGESSDGRQALTCVAEAAPDLVIMDLHLPDGDGIAVSRQILQESPQTRILIISGHIDPVAVNEALRAGAAGYLLKDEASDELIRAARTVMAGQVYLCPTASTVLAEGLRSDGLPLPSKTPKLSSRELEVLTLVVEGLRNKEMADRLGVSTKSVETYRSRLMGKLGCSSTAELVRYALREGLARL